MMIIMALITTSCMPQDEIIIKRTNNIIQQENCGLDAINIGTYCIYYQQTGTVNISYPTNGTMNITIQNA